MHRAHWGGYHYLITGKNELGEVTYEGGWQNNRQMGMHPNDRMVENIFEELDAPGEWYHDNATSTLYFYPPEGMDIPHWIQPTGPAGSVMVFNGQCWHGGGANCSQERRRAVFGHYRLDAWMRFQTDPAQYVDEAQWQRMTDRQRELLRMTYGQGQKNAADYYPDQMRDKRYD